MFKKLGWLMKRCPHPSYGNYGGFYRRCKNKKLGICPIPIDWMDEVFRCHDDHIYNNYKLVRKLKQGSATQLGLYGKVYRLGTIAVFSIGNWFDGF